MSTRLLPGEIIPGTRYRILAKVGQGAMGLVYAAEHVDLEKKVAIKLLAGRVAQRDDAVERFRQEARAASKIGSPYICDVTDFGQLPDGRLFFVMEFLEGQSLRAVLDAEGRLPAERAIPLLRQAAKALGAAHEKGIIHLDVKPDNFMLLPRSRRGDAVKVVDFGVAGLLAHGRDASNEETVNGTPAYMAPERALGRGYDHRSDIYSLGITAYELLTGTIPFEAEDVVTTLRKHVNEMPDPLRHRIPQGRIHAELEAVVLKMLAKDPAERPQSMAEAEAMLCEAQIAAGIETRWDDLELPPVDDEWRTRLAERMPSPRSRRTRVMLGGAVSVAALAIVAAVYFGVFRKKLVLVPVEVTRTEEPANVAERLQLAARAARAQRYAPPPDDSALVHLEQAENEAAKLGLDSPGARTLRNSFAQALAVIAENLLQAGMRDLAVAKFKEALLFDPGDPELRRKAELTPSEHRELEERARKRPSERAVARKPVNPEDQTRSVAASLFVAAQNGHFSEARAALRTLKQLDRNGAQEAKLADGLRPLARAAWTGGRPEEARALYGLVADLDPGDPEARERLRAPPPRAAPEPTLAAAAAPAEPPAVQGRTRRRAVEGDDVPEAPRDVAAGRSAASVGTEALAKGRLDEAEAAFRRAVRADPLNSVAVGGLAEVAFERARYTEALDWGRRATKLAPKSARFFTIVGDAYFKLLRYTEARAAYERALALAPDDAKVLNRMHRVKEKLGVR